MLVRFWAVSSIGRVSPWRGEGWGFESPTVHLVGVVELADTSVLKAEYVRVRIPPSTCWFGRLAQRLERSPYKRRVRGSSPLPTIMRDAGLTVGPKRYLEVESVDDMTKLVKENYPKALREGSVGAWSWAVGDEIVAEAWMHATKAGWWLRIKPRSREGQVM